MPRLRLIAAAALALVLLLPATALAASYDIGGTVTDKGGAPVAGVEVAVLVQGNDQILSTTTDASGAWALTVDAEPGAVLEINATGPTVVSEPDAKGCVTRTTPSGQVNATIPAEGPVDAINVPLDTDIVATVCTPVKTPPNTGGSTKTHRPAVTPPSTDTAARGDGPASSSALLVLGALLGIIGGAFASGNRRRTVAERARRRR